jgi:hypothetical protein
MFCAGDQNRRRVAAVSELGRKLAAIEDWQQHIEDDGRVFVLLRHAQSLGAIAGDLDRVADLLEALSQDVNHLRVVLDDENARAAQ